MLEEAVPEIQGPAGSLGSGCQVGVVGPLRVEH